MPAGLAAIALLLAGPAFAQSAPAGRPASPGGAPDGWAVTVGFAPVLSPVWQGSRDVALSVFPDLRINYRDVLFASVPDGIGWNAVRNEAWRAGPLVKIRFGRDEENGGSPFLIAGGSDALLGLGDVAAAAEPGAFVEHRFGARRVWRARAEVRRGFGGHEGVVADISLNRQARIGRAIANIGPRASFASKDFVQTYFGIDAEQSARSGLARYDADGGLVSAGLGGTVIRPLGPRSALTLFGGVDYLGDPAGRSPLVRERGRRLQFTLGLGYGIRFGL